MTISITVLIVILLYAFQGVFALAPYFLGILFRFFYYPLQIISQVIYPVGSIVFVMYTGLAVYSLFKLITQFFNVGGSKSGDDRPRIFSK